MILPSRRLPAPRLQSQRAVRRLVMRSAMIPLRSVPTGAAGRLTLRFDGDLVLMGVPAAGTGWESPRWCRLSDRGAVGAVVPIGLGPVLLLVCVSGRPRCHPHPEFFAKVSLPRRCAPRSALAARGRRPAPGACGLPPAARKRPARIPVGAKVHRRAPRLDRNALQGSARSFRENIGFA